ncbi:protease IV (PspA) [hydrothermal vent metagenome]|uniref:Protease IV (PspA) n=1 Tax=hydrothermal vent metagenome TaxID=652676 RepID=A0A1W1D2E4_9ZZZZ
MELIKKIFSILTAPIRFIQNNFKAMVFLLIVVLIFAPKDTQNFQQNNLEKISLIGPILNPTEVLKKIDDVTKNPHIKGVLFVVDSPGGRVAPSVEIAYAIKRLTQKKPVVVYAQGTIASGSYYASIWANKIIANPGSMVGSIGVIMEGANISGLMDKIGIQTQIVQAGKYKTVGTPTRKWKSYEKAELFTAKQAKNVGLIDEVGVMYDAKSALIQLANVKKPIWNKEDKFDKLFKKLSAQSATTLYTYFPSLSLK